MFGSSRMLPMIIPKRAKKKTWPKVKERRAGINGNLIGKILKIISCGAKHSSPHELADTTK